MTNAAKTLNMQLGEYGLNPGEWKVQWLHPNFHKCQGKKQIHSLRIINQMDESFYFEAEARVEPDRVTWENLQLVDL